jgi:hypothetical protein
MGIPAVMAVFTATMTLTSDTQPVKVHIKSPKGTRYFGGAGLDGVYIEPTLNALRQAGIENVSVELDNTATKYFPKKIEDGGTIIDAFRAGLTLASEDGGQWPVTVGMYKGKQFNLIGYSYGSLLAAQTANFYAKKGVKIDHLVLIGSPIESVFLADLITNNNIKNVIILNLDKYGDEIYAGMPRLELMNPYLIKKLGEDMMAGKGQGHFYFGHNVPDLSVRLKWLANWLYSKGLR